MLAGVYYGAEYGGSTASILLNLPGTPSNAVTCLDGYALAKQGRAGVALFTAAISSFVGGSIGVLLLMFLTPAMIAVAFAIGPAEYVALMVFGLIAAGTVAQGSPIKGLAMVVLGLLLGTIGIDLNSGAVRFSLGFVELYDGIDIVVLAMGLFGISEVIGSIGEQSASPIVQKIALRSLLPKWDEVRASILPVLRGSVVGSLFGPLPGTGPATSAFVSYALEKQVARHPQRFGNGAIEGVAAPEAANNAAAQTAFIPTLGMGIPGTATMAIILAALIINNIVPGPRLITDHPDLFWAVATSFWIGNVLLILLNIPLIGVWVSLLRIPYKFLYPAIVVLICVGSFSASNNVFDIWMLLAVAGAGYLLKYLKFEPAPLLIGFVLGPLFEENLRRTLLLSHGDYLALVNRPVSGTLMATAVLLAVFMVGRRLLFSRRVPTHQA